MIEQVDPLSVVGVCVLAVRGCASARGRLSTVLVGGRLSRNHAHFAMFMPTSFRMICSVSGFLMLCVVRNAGCCCCLVPSRPRVFLWPFVGYCFCETATFRMRVRHLAFLRLKKLVRLFPSLSCFLGVAGTFQTYDGVLDSLLYVWLQVAMCGAC